MAMNPTPNFEVPTEMRDFAEKSVEQARKAIDGFMGAAQKTVDTFEGSANTVQSSAKDMTRKTFAYAEQNITAAFDMAQRMVRAKDMQEAMQVQAEFVRQQFESMQAQMRELGALAQGAVSQATNQASQAAKPPAPKK
jgi:phasin